MSDQKSGGRKSSRIANVSLFRPGRAMPSTPQPVDLSVGREIFSSKLPVLYSTAKVWESLSQVSLSAGHLLGNSLFAETAADPITATFDLLRTRLLHGLKERNFRRIAVTSPTHGCGKSFVATNLALSLARRTGSKSVLMDLDLRRPKLADMLGVADVPALGEFLAGERPLESQFRRFGWTLALGLNGAPIDAASEALHDPQTAVALDSILDQLDPDVVIYDMPPLLVGDDVLAMAPCLDAVLLVTDGTKTTPQDIRACERLLEGRLPLMGVILNRTQDRNANRHVYGKE